MNTKNLVIVGGGFGGVMVAKRLANNPNLNITLINNTAYHSFHANLYEVATSPEEVTSIDELKKSVSVPLAEIFEDVEMDIIVGKVESVDFETQEVYLQDTNIKYDYLVLATGSVSEYYNVPGAKEFGYTLKSLTDALKLRNETELLVEKASVETTKAVLRFVIAGGGYTGVEYAAELSGFLDFLSWKYSYPREKLEIIILESGPEFFRGAMNRAAKDSYGRLKDKGVRIQLFSTVKEVEQKDVVLASGDKMSYDLLIWAAGVCACGVPSKQKLELSGQSRISVNEFLKVRSVEKGNVFAVGDVACATDENGMPVPCTAQDAVHQAKYLAQTIGLLKPDKYVPKSHGYIVMLGGKWAIFYQHPFYITGYVAWFIGQLAHLRYYIGIVGFWKAVQYILFQMKVYSKND